MSLVSGAAPTGAKNAHNRHEPHPYDSSGTNRAQWGGVEARGSQEGRSLRLT
ncbi:unannotated protein [freshwater metagenome]|uniref:Unannotated protein n=1 Tax=freshwater metagenome TaxID=449393 RepID=A0A6J7C293_9ZZZZ